MRRWSWLLFLLVLLVRPSVAQTPILGDRILVGTLNWCLDSGAVNAYSCSLGYTITAYVDNMLFSFTANSTNTGAATVNFNGLGTRTIKKMAGGITTDLAAGDINTGQRVLLMYNLANTTMQMLSQPGVAATGGAISGGTNQGAVYATGTTTATSTAAMTNGQVMMGTTGSNPSNKTLALLSAKTAGYTVTNTDFHAYTTFTVASGGAFTFTLPASASQPAAGTFVKIINYSAGAVTIARNNTNLNGGTASIVLRAASATNPRDATIFSDGTNYFASVQEGMIPVVAALTDSTTLAINSDNYDMGTLATMGTAGTYTVQTDTGAPVDGQKLTLRLTSAASRTVAWTSGVAKSYRGGTMPCPTATSGGGLTDYVGLIYNGSATRWDCVSFASGYQ